MQAQIDQTFSLIMGFDGKLNDNCISDIKILLARKGFVYNEVSERKVLVYHLPAYVQIDTLQKDISGIVFTEMGSYL